MCGLKRYFIFLVVRNGVFRLGFILNFGVLCYEFVGDECYVLVIYMIGFLYIGGIGKVLFVEIVRGKVILGLVFE